MIKGHFPSEKFMDIRTPLYYYDVELLRNTLDIVKEESSKHDFKVHYAIKANSNRRILSIIAQQGLGADCVSGGEIKTAIESGFDPRKIVFAGIGKADWEINFALNANIQCFNVESLAELMVINELATAKGKIAPIALRVNPDVDAYTHAKITTGTKENKFGINLSQLNDVLEIMQSLGSISFTGLHFHIGSQITNLEVFKTLSLKVNEILNDLEARGINVPIVNFGGGLGIDYGHPNHLAIPDFKKYFSIIAENFERRQNQEVHFEPGRSIVGQCGTLISKVLYIKEGEVKKFAILDAGFTELIRPAMYDSSHHIENISSESDYELYDIVGPVCESSDVFAKDFSLNGSKRGDIIALRSAGAYGEVMASSYNCRDLPHSYFSDML